MAEDDTSNSLSPGRETVGPVLAQDDRLALRPFDARWAGLVAGWVRNDAELFWIAPKTPAPITPEKVLGWSVDRDYSRVVCAHGTALPVAYGELHYMPASRTHLWLGHLLVSPACRGKGVGGRLTRLLLIEAFEVQRARRVSLIVFPTNVVAIRCYQRAGLIYLGEQKRFFETTGRYHRMIALSMDRRRYRKTKQTGERRANAPSGGTLF